MYPEEPDPHLSGLAQPVVARDEDDPTRARLHPVLSEEQLLEVLAQMPEWRLDGGRLVRAAHFASEAEASRFAAGLEAHARELHVHVAVDQHGSALEIRLAHPAALEQVTAAEVDLAEQIDGWIG